MSVKISCLFTRAWSSLVVGYKLSVKISCLITRAWSSLVVGYKFAATYWSSLNHSGALLWSAAVFFKHITNTAACFQKCADPHSKLSIFCLIIEHTTHGPLSNLSGESNSPRFFLNQFWVRQFMQFSLLLALIFLLFFST